MSNNPMAAFLNSVKLPKQRKGSEDRSVTNMTSKTKRSKKSIQRKMMKNVVENDEEINREKKEKAKEAAFVAVKNLWS